MSIESAYPWLTYHIHMISTQYKELTTEYDYHMCQVSDILYMQYVCVNIIILGKLQTLDILLRQLKQGGHR